MESKATENLSQDTPIMVRVNNEKMISTSFLNKEILFARKVLLVLFCEHVIEVCF